MPPFFYQPKGFGERGKNRYSGTGWFPITQHQRIREPIVFEFDFWHLLPELPVQVHSRWDKRFKLYQNLGLELALIPRYALLCTTILVAITFIFKFMFSSFLFFYTCVWILQKCIRYFVVRCLLPMNFIDLLIFYQRYIMLFWK